MIVIARSRGYDRRWESEKSISKQNKLSASSMRYHIVCKNLFLTGKNPDQLVFKKTLLNCCDWLSCLFCYRRTTDQCIQTPVSEAGTEFTGYLACAQSPDGDTLTHGNLCRVDSCHQMRMLSPWICLSESYFLSSLLKETQTFVPIKVEVLVLFHVVLGGIIDGSLTCDRGSNELI